MYTISTDFKKYSSQTIIEKNKYEYAGKGLCFTDALRVRVSFGV